MLMITLLQMTEAQLPTVSRAPQEKWHDFLGYKIASPIGISACAATHSTGIRLAARLGCDVLTYKTIRCHEWPAHPQPNIAFVNCPASLMSDDIGKTVVASDNQFLCSSNIAIANSFGNQSMDPDWVKNDIQKAKQSLLPGQVLIVSVFGNTHDEWIKAAQLAVESGADIIEANFSCPNLNTHNQPLYTLPDDIFSTAQTLVQSIPTHIPLILKFGVFTDKHLMRQALIAAAQAGARGICGINTIPMKVVNADGAPTFGNRIFAGVSGAPIQQLALDFIKKASTIIHQENLKLVLLAVGGIMKPSHFLKFLHAGATIALSATGMMYNPCLASHYHEQRSCIMKISSGNKEKYTLLHLGVNKFEDTISLNKEILAAKLFDMGVVKFGDFIFKSGIRSNNYIDMRLAVSYPDVLQALAIGLKGIQQKCDTDILCAVPHAAGPVTTTLSLLSGIPMIMARQQAKDHGTKKMIEGVYVQGQKCLIIEDVITTGSSVLETIKTVEAAGLQVKDVIGLIDRQQGGRENITSKGYNFHALFTLQELLYFLKQSKRLSQQVITDMFKHSSKL
ncbi:MAG TPA: orotate phosphoribosyltransferase [Candidatus Babeliales bacterium]|nr:orotate phosphoribosyltransferase [Candidatus Babeliales bacterium]